MAKEVVKFARGKFEDYEKIETKNPNTMYLLDSSVGTGIDEKLAGKIFMGAEKICDSETSGIYIDEDFTVSGLGSTKFGNIGDGYNIKSGTDLLKFLKDVLTKEIYPNNATQPTYSMGNTGFTSVGNVEAGTKINFGSVTYSGVTTGSYNNNGWTVPAQPKTEGVIWSDYKVVRTVAGFDASLNNVTLLDGTQEGPFQNINDSSITNQTIGQGTFSVVYTGKANSTAATNNPITNQGELYTIGGGTQVNTQTDLTKTTSITWNGQRKYFSGVDSVNINPIIDSAYVRALSGASALNPINGTSFTINQTNGNFNVIFAYPATLRDVTDVKSQNLGGASVKGNFTKQLVNVEGLNGFTTASYKVYVWNSGAGIPGNDVLTVVI